MSPIDVAVLGGTGPQGKGLAYRFAAAGHRVVIGSRNAEKSQQAAEEVAEKSGHDVAGKTNEDAAASAEIVILAVPYAGHADFVAGLASSLSGKILVSCVNPLGFDKSGPYGLTVADGSAAQEAQRLVPSARVIGAFHHVSAVTLWKASADLSEQNILVCGDDAAAKDAVIALAAAIGGRDGLDAGPLRTARELEPLTAVLINMNKRYKTHTGVRISGMS